MGTVHRQVMGRMGSNGVAAIAVVICMLAWLWPIGIAGKMPVGGDVTQFFMGLMGELSTSLRAGRLPVWNDLWGYGFPGLAESQMGIYYAPHVILYGIFPTELAYTLSLVIHTIWGALGAFWLARRLTVSAAGSILAGFSFSASGFFVIHIPHPWGYTTASWMPWAWGHAWWLLNHRDHRFAGPLFRLSLILVLQLLPGHFQVAFMTNAGILLMTVWTLLVEPRLQSRKSGDWAADTATIPRIRNAALVAACMLMAFPLAGLQLVPTARLARLASNQRDFNYLSLCATTPLHLVNYVAPGLFHRSPLWRPLVWTPFHTSPEEQLAYVGLVPLFLAVMAMNREARGDPGVRVLSFLAVTSALLSLGPFVPGFHQLIGLPGFSFFRAPARWGVVTSLALAVLAGKGLDRWKTWRTPSRSLIAMAILSSLWIGLVLGGVELALGAGSGAGHSRLNGLFRNAFEARPWADEHGFLSVQAQARRPVTDFRVPVELKRAGLARKATDPRSFVERRYEIYRTELGETVSLLVAIVALALIGETRKGRPALPVGLLILSLVDLMLLGRHKLTDVGPLRPLIEQSPVLARLASLPRGTRSVDGFRNLSMLAGVAPISAYRTLDLPALEPLTAMARGPLGSPESGGPVRKAMRAAGVEVRVLDPVEVAMERRLTRGGGSAPASEAIADPALAGWLYGSSWMSEQGEWSSLFRVIELKSEPHRAWFLPLTAVARPAMLETWSGEVGPLLELLDRARPITVERLTSQLLEVNVETDEAGWIIVTQLADPQWQGRWIGLDSEGQAPAEILPAFRRGPAQGGWQRVRVPGPGRWTLRMEYAAEDVAEGLGVSAAAALLWVIALAGAAVRSRRRINS